MRGLCGVAFRSVSSALSRRFHTPYLVKPLSTAVPSDIKSLESMDEFEQRMFGGASSEPFYQKLDRLQISRKTPGSRSTEGNNSRIFDGLEENFSTLSDGVDGKLKQEARYFDIDVDEVLKPDYSFRPDVRFQHEEYDIKDLDLTRPGVPKPFNRYEFEVTTEEVLRKADFRNVRFLANFITEAGILIKRSKTGISAKAQRKVAREIKTARAFGLMPFTTMGTKAFVFGKSMERLDSDFEYQSFNDDSVVDEADDKDP